MAISEMDCGDRRGVAIRPYALPWHTLGVYAGWTFLLHLGVLTGLTYFVGAYKPKG